MNALLSEELNSHLYVLTLKARDAELQAANAVKGGVVPMQVTDWQARVPGRVGDHDPRKASLPSLLLRSTEMTSQ